MPAATRGRKRRRERAFDFQFLASTTVSKYSSIVLGHEVCGDSSWQTQGTSTASEGNKFLYRRAGQASSNGCVFRSTGGSGWNRNTEHGLGTPVGSVSCGVLWGARIYDRVPKVREGRYVWGVGVVICLVLPFLEQGGVAESGVPAPGSRCGGRES